MIPDPQFLWDKNSLSLINLTEYATSEELCTVTRPAAPPHSVIHLSSLQTLNSISAEKNSTIIFPLPIDLITNFLKSDDKAGKGD